MLNVVFVNFVVNVSSKSISTKILGAPCYICVHAILPPQYTSYVPHVMMPTYVLVMAAHIW